MNLESTTGEQKESTMNEEELINDDGSKSIYDAPTQSESSEEEKSELNIQNTSAADVSLSESKNPTKLQDNIEIKADVPAMDMSKPSLQESKKRKLSAISKKTKTSRIQEVDHQDTKRISTTDESPSMKRKKPKTTG
jgi:hypothetical protein